MRHIQRETRSYLRQIRKRGFERVIGTSGTILSLGALAGGAKRPPEEVRNLRVSVKALGRLRDRLTKMTLDERLHLPGLDPRRADLAVPGVVLLDTLLERAGRDRAHLCDFALREGLVLDYIQKNASHIRTVERYPDVRRRSVIELAERCGYRAAARPAGRAPGARALRRDQGPARLGRARARVARIRRAAPRHRHPHQLRAAPQALVLPDQARRLARLRSRGDRDHRAHRAIPSAGGRRRRSHEGFGAARRGRAADRPAARRDRAPGRGPRPQPRAGHPRREGRRSRRRCSTCGSRRTATPSSSSGPPIGTRRRWPRCSAGRFSSKSWRRPPAPKDANAHADHARHPHSIPASCSSSRASTGPARRRSSACSPSGSRRAAIGCSSLSGTRRRS